MLESLRIIAKDCEIAVESAASWFSFLCMKSEVIKLAFEYTQLVNSDQQFNVNH